MPCLDYNLVQEPVTLSFIYVDVEALMDYSVSIGSGDVSSLVKTDLYCLFMMSALSFGLWCIFSFLWCYAVVGLSKCLSDIIPEYLVYVFQSDCLPVHSHIYLCVQWFALFCIHVNVVSLYVTLSARLFSLFFCLSHFLAILFYNSRCLDWWDL